MLWRNLRAEFADFLGRPLQWISILIVSLVVLAGVDQLALDTSTVNVLIVDSDPGRTEGSQIKSLIKELSGVEARLAPPLSTLETVIGESKSNIIIHKVDNLWHATLRPRSILDHRRLARVGFSLAAIINRLTPLQ